MREERDDSIRLHDISGRDVIARAESTNVGAVSDILYSPTDGHIGFVLLETTGGFGGLVGRHKGVRGDVVMAIGRDAVMVRDLASVIEDMDQIDRSGLVSAGDVKGLTVVSDEGERVGQVKDFIISPAQQRILGYVVGSTRTGPFGLGGDQRGAEGERVIPVQADVTIGSELITVPASVLREGQAGTVEREIAGDERTTRPSDTNPEERWPR